MSLLTYKWLHLAGIFLFFMSFGAHIFNVKINNSKATRFIQINMGIALLVILVAGFGMLAKITLVHLGWISTKIVIWIFFAAMIVLVKKLPKQGHWFWYIAWVFGISAVYMALFKPF